MIKLQNIIEKYPNKVIPNSEDEIRNLEETHKISFPLSYREYLKLSGKYSEIHKVIGWFKYFNENQLRAKELLDQYKLHSLIQKPFWVIATDYGAFWYFHFDEGDNPPLYRLDCEYYGDMDDKYTFGKVAKSFQAWVEKKIDFYERDPENK